MLEFMPLREELAHYLNQEKIDLITQAFVFASAAHEHQMRISGLPYITHPVAVARQLAVMRMDYETIMAALLHDVLEDTTITKQLLIEKFGENVAELVDGVSKLTKIPFEDHAKAQAESFRKMFLAMTKDIRVILIKLADRLHNMRTISPLRREKQKRIAQETLEIYAPIANRLGMNKIYTELEDLGFQAYYPMRYHALQKAVKKARGNRKKMVSTIETALQNCLAQAGIPPDLVLGREKHLYSIYKKMRDKQMSFNDIMDRYAFRIVVPTIDACYRTLGLVHGLYKPVPGRFKDYIAIPKANSYQSLHTALFGPFGVPIEIQIRTPQMHEIAEQGIAAHWHYKMPESQLDQAQTRTRAWLRHILEMEAETGTSVEFIENMKIDLFPDEVYVFTPKGKIIALPARATPVDFAYAVHTDIGNHCVAARIDRQLAPLSTILTNGRTVEIVTAARAHPHSSWLDFVITGKARSNIRHVLKTQHSTELVTLGRNLLTSALDAIGIKQKDIAQTTLDVFLEKINVKSNQALYEALGRGERNSFLVAQQLAELVAASQGRHLSKPLPEAAILPLMIKGTEGVAVKFANCCWPIPGDTIIGALTPETGLVVHVQSCPVLSQTRGHGQRITTSWEADVVGEFPIKLKVELENQRGILAALSLAISSTGANVREIYSETVEAQYSTVALVVLVRDRIHLARILRNIRRIPEVVKVRLPL